MDRIPIALQLYSIREDCARDLEGSIKAVAEMGYEGVEFAGYYERDADELKDLCAAYGLAVVGTHIGLDTLLGGELEATLAFNKALDNRYLIVPGLTEERRASRAAWLGRRASSTKSRRGSNRTICARATTTTTSNSNRWGASCRGTPSLAIQGPTW